MERGLNIINTELISHQIQSKLRHLSDIHEPIEATVKNHRLTQQTLY